MRNGSSAHDGDGWPSAQNPYRDDALSGSGPYGPGRRSEPREVPGRRREAPFGPEVSWPNGFRQVDPEARRLLEAGYGRSQRDRLDPGYGPGAPGVGYRQPAMDDFGYGDPGYSDPSYDGPRSGSAGHTWPGGSQAPRTAGGAPAASSAGYGGPPGYQFPDFREPSRPDSGHRPGFASDTYPVTGAQEALPATGPQPVAEAPAGRDPGSRPAYPEQWYGHPRLNDPRPASDPRLEGLRYDELRYDEPVGGEPGYDEPLDDESWYSELRRSAPAYPPPPGGQPAGDQRRGDPRGP